MTALICALLLGIAPLKVGDVAPDFSAVDAAGTPFSLHELLKEGLVVLAFYPKAFTPGCTKEMSTFSGRFAELHEKGVAVVAVSGDDAETLKRFKQELKAAYLFVPDPKAKLMELYQVRAWPTKWAKRVTFVIKPEASAMGPEKDKIPFGKILRIDRGDEAVRAGSAIDFAMHP